MKNKITTEWVGGMQFESDNPSGKTVIMDTDVEGSTVRYGLSPKAMMLSSLAGCSGLDVVSVLEKMKVEDYKFKMDVEGELTDEHPKYYHTVTVDYHFYGKDLNESKINKAVNLSVDKYCGVMEMFRKFATVKTNIHIHNS
ncbi:OsmC family protein [Bizionia paragorgiae]|uniref:Putative redox protein n=1 Tax=Bizionia paragorgiae TaxID=283786 RepID=A0A1H4CE10_BIZPA|nr:OsmC family protein [Bizionia paragorgiae]SEA58533.1 putative redox protein [Bizionia paragorgiae]